MAIVTVSQLWQKINAFRDFLKIQEDPYSRAFLWRSCAEAEKIGDTAFATSPVFLCFVCATEILTAAAALGRATSVVGTADALGALLFGTEDIQKCAAQDHHDQCQGNIIS